MDSPPKNKIAYLLERLAQGVAAHDRENPGHHTWGIGMAHFDIERLGLDVGEEILPGIVLQADGGVTGQFRILCAGEVAQAVAEHRVFGGKVHTKEGARLQDPSGLGTVRFDPDHPSGDRCGVEPLAQNLHVVETVQQRDD